MLIPCLLFAIAHVQRGIDSGQTTSELIAFFVLNTALPFVIFLTVVRSRDVVWIGLVHYLLDVATRAF